MKKVPFFRQKFTDENISNILTDVEGILKSGQLIFNKNVKKFEDAFAKEIGVKFAVSVNSCTTALMICLEYFNRRKLKVLLPSATFITTANSVLFTGAEPVFVDIQEGTLLLDFDDIKKKAGNDVSGLILVHLLGFMNKDMEKIRDFCSNNDLFLIEDAAHAIGTSLNGVKAGALGDAGCFSFYATKHVSTGGAGGMITTNDEDLCEFARKKRIFGKDSATGVIEYFGNDWFLDEIRASIGYSHLSFLKENLSLREKSAKKYDAAFRDFKNLKIFESTEGSTASLYQYAVLLSEGIDRSLLMKRLSQEHGIDTKPIYDPCHLETIYQSLPAYKNVSLPVTEDILNRSLAIPFFPGISGEEIETVLDAMRQEVG